MPASIPTPDDHGIAPRSRMRIGFALTHLTVALGLVLGADLTTGVVGAALLGVNGLIELQWHVADRAAPAGIPARAVYPGPS